MTTSAAAAVGAAVTGAMRAAGRNPQWLAENSGIERSRIEKLLLGASDFTFAELFTVASVLGLPVHHLAPSADGDTDDLPTIAVP